MWKQQLLKTNRGLFEIFVRGKGKPVCITHLYSEFNELGYYFADTFVHQFKVILVNLKEAGNSCRADLAEELSMAESVKDLEAVREALGFEKWSFAGHSTGGMLGLVYGDLYSDSLEGLVVGGAAASKKYMENRESMYCSQSPLNKRLREIFAILKSPEATVEEKRNANKEWTNMSLFNADKREDYFKRPSSGRVVQRRLDYYSFQELPLFDIREKLSGINIPTLVYCGSHDKQCPLHYSEEIHREIPNSQLYIFNESNHLPYLEEESRFLSMVEDFKESL
ncbi:alpha/beta fold hydrolase [Rossellomorea vietnamensis]|uniref:Alpha/beta fold hydrolase n=1 Tax=Rossellomorea vietnamensis TaxID=218284 RepID=A0A5D4KL47_9BACI|nr:alpha/beta fold hydrolase [Rossellomorea vietnamensis]TYR77033.1 alpha/beta fold hydrolase [Rossellomorea vietnamensis]